MIIAILLLLVLIGATASFCLLFADQAERYLGILAHNRITTWVLDQTDSLGFPFDKYAVFYIAGIALIILLFVASRRGSNNESELEEANESLESANKRLEELDAKLKDMSTLTLMPTKADVVDRVRYLEIETAKVREHLSVLANQDLVDDEDEHNDSLRRVEVVSERIVGLSRLLSERSAVASSGNSVDELSSSLNSLREPVQRFAKSDAEKSAALTTIEADIKKLEDAMGAYDLSNERFNPLKARIEKINAELLEYGNVEGGLVESVRENERLLAQAKTRFTMLKPAEGQDINTRIAKLASELTDLERKADQIDPVAARQAADALEIRLQGLFAQMGTPKLRAVAAE